MIDLSLAASHSSLLKHAARRVFWRPEKCHIRIGVVDEPSTSRPQTLSDTPAGWNYRRTLYHRRRHRTIGSILRNGLRRSHSEQRRQQRPPGHIQIANTWLIVNVGGGPTPDKPTVTLSVPADPDSVSSFMNIRVADIQACYEL
jgi:hypothetical protein